jgi:2-keto-4-pentenoate hydratase/2-oxohepta-3-ene-1,7-dioic acid hydratase in catechol pathway
VRLGNLRVDGSVRPVAVQAEQLVELSSPSLEALLAGGSDAVQRALESPLASHPLDPTRLGPAPARPGKVLCIGRNYVDHAEEVGATPPAKPEVFMRALTSLAGPCDAVFRPRVSQMLDYEVELAVVIGRRGRYIRAGDALDHVAGYCVFNDFSVRDFQSFGTQWTPGKNFDGTGPLGPFLVTADEVPDPQALELSCAVAGPSGVEETLQSSSTALMVHRIPDLIAFLSLWTTLEPGDVIATGTPGGVGAGRDPKRWLVPGETVITRVEGLGALKNQVLEEPAPTS